MSTWMREVSSAARALLRRPGFTAVVLVTLSLGIGVNVAIFTVVSAVLLKPLPYPDSDRIVEVRHHAPGLELDELLNSGGTGRFYQEQAGAVFEAFALVDDGEINLTGTGRPERVAFARVTPSFFRVMRTTPAVGRGFTEAEGRPDGPEVAVLTHRAWVTRFGADPEVVGRTLELDGVATEIVGVMPEGFAYPEPETEVLVPERVGPDAPFGVFGRVGLGRLAPGMDLERARREVSALQARLPEAFADMTPEFFERARWSVSVDPLKDRLVGDVRASLWIVLGTVGFVLLIACANVANLFLVRAESRQRELAIRAAMGAGWGRLTLTFLAESVLLGIVAGVLALLLATAGVHALVVFGPAELPRLQEVRVDGWVLGFAALLSVGAGVGLGLLPVARYVRGAAVGILREGDRGTTEGRGRLRARNVLVASQLALALVLLVGSGLMLRSFQRLRHVDPGVDAGDVLTVGLSVGEGREQAEARAFYETVVERVRALPGVKTAGVSTAIPLRPGGMNGGSFARRSRPRAEDELPPVAMNVFVTDGAVESLDIPVLRGRAPTVADRDALPAVVWVNETFARQFFDGDAVGELIGESDEGPWAEIVGVVGDVRQFGLQAPVRPLVYAPLADSTFQGRKSLQSMVLTVEADGDDPLALAPGVRRLVAEVDPTVPITTVRTLERLRRESMASTSFTLVLLGLAAAVALLLGAVGIYGVVSYVVSQRTREIGVRLALGARTGDVRAMVVRQGLAVTLVGVALGLVAAFGLTRLMASLLFEVSATDPLTFAAVPVVLVGVATLASYLPARRASRVDPSEALRAE